MTFKPALWFPIAGVLTVVNVAAIGFAAAAPEPLHAVTHGAIAVAFAVWAQRLRVAPRESQQPQVRLDVLEGEVNDLRRRLRQTQEGLDFAERLLEQRPQAVHAEAQRSAENDTVS